MTDCSNNITGPSDLDVQLVFIESDDKFSTMLELFDGNCSNSKILDVLFGLITSYISGDFDENDTKQFLLNYYQNIISENCTSISLLMSEWSDYVSTQDNTQMFNLLNKLLLIIKEIQIENNQNSSYQNFNIVMTKKVWECECFRKLINMFPECATGDAYVFNGMFCSLFTMKSWEINFESYIGAIKPLIQEVTIHNYLINYIGGIIKANIAYTYEDVQLVKSKYCSPLNFNSFLLHILVKIMDYYGLDTITNKLLQTDELQSNMTQPDEPIVVKLDEYVNLPFYYKLYFTTLAAIPICHTAILKHYDALKAKLNFSMLLSPKLKAVFQDDMLRCADLIKNRNDCSLNKNVQNLYLSYFKLAPIVQCQELFVDIVSYTDYATRFSQVEKFYGELDKELFNVLSNIAGGYNSIVKNVHVRHYSCALIFKLLSVEGFSAFENLYENLFKYISEVDFFEWSSIESSIDHQYKLVETIYFLTDSYNHEISGERNVVAGTLYVLLKSAIKLLDLINELCAYYKSKSTASKNTSIFEKMINAISMTLQIHQNVYDKKIIKIIYPEVELKYSILIQQLLEIVVNKDHDFAILRRPDLVGIILTVVCESIGNHIDFCFSYLTNIRGLITEAIQLCSSVSTFKRNHILEKINVQKIEIDYPAKFLDPLLCTEITDPIKIPDINEIFDRSSILSHIYDSKENPYTRDPLTVEILEEYNKKDFVIKDIQAFLEDKKKFIEEFNAKTFDTEISNTKTEKE